VQVVKDDPLFNTYESFYNSGSQSWRIKKYGTVCIVADAFLGAVVSSGTGTALTTLAEVCSARISPLHHQISHPKSLTLRFATFSIARIRHPRQRRFRWAHSWAHAACADQGFLWYRPALSVPVPERLHRAFHRQIVSGQSSFTAVPGRQHSCSPFALVQTLASNGFDVTLLYTPGREVETATLEFWVQYYHSHGIKFVPLPTSPTPYDVPVDIEISHRVYIWLSQQARG
jgi:hypothetical protein